MSTGKKLTYMAAPEEMRLDRWAHVAGTYDGAVMRLFVDGREIRPSSMEFLPGDVLETYRLRGRMPIDARTLRRLLG